MHVTHPQLHPRRALLAGAAALVLALLAFVPATLDDLSLGAGARGPSATAAPAPAAAPARAEPRWLDNPFAWPLLQMPSTKR